MPERKASSNSDLLQIKTIKDITDCVLCGDNNGPTFLHAKCHLTAPLSASMENGILTLRCYVPDCRRVVSKFKIDRIEQ